MAAKRGKSQAKRNGGGGGGMPGWSWLVIGLALGIGVWLLAPKFGGKDGVESFFRSAPKDAPPQAIDGSDDNTPLVPEDPPATTEKRGDDYDFYTLLPGEETALSDRELDERARAEAADREDAGGAGEKPTGPNASTTRPDATNPDAADPASATDVDPPVAIDAVPKPDQARDSASKPPSDDERRADARYLLQAGAFAASGDAEALKAKIAFLGLGARVESAQIKGKTVYRVRMGPYGSATELAEAKRKLAAGGLPALAIRVK